MAPLRRLGLSESALHHFVAARVTNAADAEDIAQQALLQACNKISTFRGENLSAWLFAIARNLIVDYYRARNRHEFVDFALAAETNGVFQTPHHTPVCACGEGFAGWVECITSRLPVEGHTALLLADVYGYCDKDSAALLGMSLPRFKLLLHHMRARLRESAGESCALVKKTNASAARRRPSAGTPGSARAGRRAGQTPPKPGIRVACPLDAGELLALRNRLLVALLKTFGFFLACLQPDTWPLELALTQIRW